MANAETAPSAEAWLKHVARWREGEASVVEYCREHGLAISAMRYQIRKAPTVPTPRVRLARVRRDGIPAAPTSTSTAVVIEVGAARIRVERGVDAATLAAVMAALGVRR